MNVKKTIAVAISMVLITLISPLSLTADNSASAETEIWDGTYDTSWYDEEETELHISTAEELAGLSELTNAGNTMAGKTIYLDNDIYLNDVSNYESWKTKAPENKWISISTISGILDGNGYTIYGMYISEKHNIVKPNYASRYTGFCKICDSEIRNISFENIYISTSLNGWNSASSSLNSSTSFFSIGGISGYCTENGSITDCEVSGTIESTSSATGFDYISSSGCYFNTAIGGIAGVNDGIISRCANNISIVGQVSSGGYYVTCYGRLYIGGISGYNSLCIMDCKNTGNLYASGLYYYYVGGICGEQISGAIENCYNTGYIDNNNHNTSYGYGGGILGYSNGGSISNVYNTGMITGSWKYAVGSICHNTPTYISNAYYLSSTAVKGIGTSDEDTTIAKSASNMQKESFAESLGEAFVYNEGGYPLLAWEAALQQEPLMGDVNLDGIFDVADIKLLQDYLVCRETLTAEQGAVADVCTDGVLDAFDLCVLKRMYLEQSETA